MLNHHNRSIRLFDSIITAPRWGYENVDQYYEKASPLKALIKNLDAMPPTLILQAEDDPWVPFKSTNVLAQETILSTNSQIRVIISKHGGHNGFHGLKGCWGDQVVKEFFDNLTSNL